MAKWKVTLSPRYDTYLGREDLACALLMGPFSAGTNLINLLPANNGVKRAFFRQMNHLINEGIQFPELKESTRDKSWAVHRGLKRKPIGSILVTYGQGSKGATWTGSKIRVKDLSRTPETLVAMDKVKLLLTDALKNPGVNAYTFHLKVLNYMSQIADMKLPRENWGLNGSELPQTSYYYIVDDKYLNDILVLEQIYDMFYMNLQWEAAK